MFSYVLKSSTHILVDIFYFPIWWYSRGVIKTSLWVKNFVIQKEKGLALLVWIKNIFTPMYGQRDILGFLISVFMRVIQIIFRSLVMAFWLLVAGGIFLFWIILPPLVAIQIIYQLI